MVHSYGESVVRDARDVVSPVAENVLSGAKDVAHKVGDKAGDAAELTEGWLSSYVCCCLSCGDSDYQFGDSISETANSVFETVSSYASGAVDRVAEVGSGFGDFIDGLAGDD